MENITNQAVEEELSESMQILEEQTKSDYKYGFTSDIEMDTFETVSYTHLTLPTKA